MKIKVLLADDHKIIREGLSSILEKHPDIIVGALAENGAEAISLAKKIKPDLIIMDISMPDLNGIEATARITSELPWCKVLALSMHADRGFLIRMLKAGASGYLLKDCASEELINAIQTVMNNSFYISPALMDDLVREYIQMTSEKEMSHLTVLTPREREVLQKLSEGKAVKEIAFDLNVSIKTVETFRYRISDKLGLHSIAELTKYAVREGLTSL